MHSNKRALFLLRQRRCSGPSSCHSSTVGHSLPLLRCRMLWAVRLCRYGAYQPSCIPRGVPHVIHNDRDISFWFLWSLWEGVVQFIDGAEFVAESQRCPPSCRAQKAEALAQEHAVADQTVGSRSVRSALRLLRRPSINGGGH